MHYSLLTYYSLGNAYPRTRLREPYPLSLRPGRKYWHPGTKPVDFTGFSEFWATTDGPIHWQVPDMSATCPQVCVKVDTEIRNALMSFASKLDDGESLTGTVTIAITA